MLLADAAVLAAVGGSKHAAHLYEKRVLPRLQILQVGLQGGELDVRELGVGGVVVQVPLGGCRVVVV